MPGAADLPVEVRFRSDLSSGGCWWAADAAESVIGFGNLDGTPAQCHRLGHPPRSATRHQDGCRPAPAGPPRDPEPRGETGIEYPFSALTYALAGVASVLSASTRERPRRCELVTRRRFRPYELALSGIPPPTRAPAFLHSRYGRRERSPRGLRNRDLGRLPQPPRWP